MVGLDRGEQVVYLSDGSQVKCSLFPKLTRLAKNSVVKFAALSHSLA